jgi:type IV pilus assembly protein PilN
VIKVNLVCTGRRPAWKAVALDERQAVTAACTLILLAAAGIIGWRGWMLQRESAQLDAALGRARDETSRLHSIIVEVQQFEQRRAELQQRVTLIEQLRRNQTGPVRLLDEISRALPPTVWLTGIKQSPDAMEVTIEGRCVELTGLSDFITGLETSGYFNRSVDIVSSETAVLPDSGSQVIAFGIKATVQPPAVPVTTQPVAPP